MRIKRNLGVSSIVATMLMIVITFSLATALAAWASTSYGAFGGGSQLYFVQRQQALEEQFAIENVFFTKSQGYIDIFVRNVGATQVSVVAVYVDEIPMTPTGTGPNGVTCTIPSGSPPGLVLGTVASSSGVSACTQTPNVADFTVHLANGFNSNCPTQPWCSGDIFYIVVASGKGNQATYTAGAP
jgi:flagellin-like protein